jgi:hypothetical protein
MGMKSNSAPGPDGFPVVFFQRFWEKIQAAILPMFQEFYVGTLDMGRLNFGVITLIPKLVGPRISANLGPSPSSMSSNVCSLRSAR